MSKQNSCLFVLSESPWLTWIPFFLTNIVGDLSLATYDFKNINNIKVFPLHASYTKVSSWIIKNKFRRVILLTNQSSLERDLHIANILRGSNIQVVSQSSQATKIGRNKIKMKHFLTKYGFNTPPYRVAYSIIQALHNSKELGFPLVLKVGGLSEGRKMALVYSEDDIATYYYENAISEPIILEKFVLGKEVSTIVYDNFGQPLVFPIISKPTTDYLFSTSTTRQRIYIAPDPKLQKITNKIQNIALQLARLLNNKLLIGFDIVVDENDELYILEFNTRMVETLRMSMLLAKFNILERLFFMVREENIKGSSIPPKGFVVDLPLDGKIKSLIINKKLNIESLAILSNTRVTIFSEEYKNIEKDLGKLSNL